jgi:outer membrane protein insertion porin family
LQFAAAVHAQRMRIASTVAALTIFPFAASAQNPSPPGVDAAVCNLPIPPPAQEPPPNASPIVFQIVPCFAKQGNISMVEPETYLHYIRTSVSRPSRNEWVPYDETAIASILEDFKRLWATGFLDDLSIEVADYNFGNGAVGKLIVYRLEERRRIKIVNYEGLRHLEQSKLEEKLRELDLTIRIDTFVDQTRIKRIKTTIAEMLADVGFPNATVISELRSLPGGPKLAHLRFTVDEGPQTRLRRIEFDGNAAFNDGELAGAMKNNRARKWLPFPSRDAAYKEGAFEEDASRLVSFYRDRGYIAARVGQPSLRTIEDSPDGKKRWVALHVPVTEGVRHRVGAFTVEGATSVRPEYLLSLFKIRQGDVYNEKEIREGLSKARDLYGSLGRFEFTAYPDLIPRDPRADAIDTDRDAIVDVTLRIQEGPRYLINRITFVGNTTTRDQVIRRELRVYEGGVFNTEALKLSIRRLNQLGYFKPIEDQKNIQVDKTPDAADTVDLTLKVEEQNRNQISFGAGMSEVYGVFVNASYATTNFLGRGETFSLNVETGSRSNNYQASLTEPYIFDRPISLGATLFSRKTDYFLTSSDPEYSEVREGASLTIGMPLRSFSRLFLGYTYEIVDSASTDAVRSARQSAAAATAAQTSTSTVTVTTTTGTTSYTRTTTPAPTFNYLIDEGRHVESRLEPTFLFDTSDNPFTPRRGMRFTAGSRVAGGGLRGSVNYVRPEAEWIVYIPHTRRTAIGLRGQIGYLRPFSATDKLPYYLRYFLGGENQIRGVDLRTVGPIDDQNQLIGGNKFVLFNAEYYFDLAPSVRALAFHDAGQAFDETRRINLRELRTSSGAELRVVIPMFNMPFRLIYAWNIYRDAFQPKRAFRFAVGTTF